jgi:hypothetical protein
MTDKHIGRARTPLPPVNGLASRQHFDLRACASNGRDSPNLFDASSRPRFGAAQVAETMMWSQLCVCGAYEKDSRRK